LELREKLLRRLLCETDGEDFDFLGYQKERSAASVGSGDATKAMRTPPA
jgi:hypothetical protein